MKTTPSIALGLAGPLARRDLVAIFAYVTPCRPRDRSVDGSFGKIGIHLDKVIAASRMQ